MYVCMYVCNMYVCMMYRRDLEQRSDQPGKIVNSSRDGQLNRETVFFTFPCSRPAIRSREEADSAVRCRVSPLILHTTHSPAFHDGVHLHR